MTKGKWIRTEKHCKDMRKNIEYFINKSGCHICISHKPNNTGYPCTTRNNRHVLISHIIYEEKTGESVPYGLNILHKCDTPMCINFEHFILGTQADNINDCITKNRFARGETNGLSKLTEKDIIAIRNDKRYSNEIAKNYGVTGANIRCIKRRVTWKHL
jgi:hypothetical protein